MKICPKCHTQYEYEMTFCLQDGARHIFSDPTAKPPPPAEEKTLVLPKQFALPSEGMKFAQKAETPQLIQRVKSEPSTNQPIFENVFTEPKTNKNLIVGLLGGILVVLGVLIGSWNYNPFASVNEAATANSNQNSNISTPDVEFSSDMKHFNEAFYDGLKGKLAALAAKNGLKPLNEIALAKDGIEVRLYLFASFYGPIYKGVAVEDSVLVLKRENTVWSGKVIRNVIKQNSDKPDTTEKIVTQLNQPLSGWDNLWQKLQENGVLAPPTKSENKVRTGSTLYVIEGKEGGKYTYFYFHVPKEKSEIDEERRIAAIFNLIAREFETSDLQAS